MLQTLRVTSIQSPNADDTCRGITEHLGHQLGVTAEFVNDIPWQEREQLLDAGEIQVGWICGLPYVWKADHPQASIELVAAPVMQHPRYRRQPIYFSDVIVHRDSEFRCFADLRHRIWAYNEPHSQSGYNITRYHLAMMREEQGFFSRVLEAGSHLRSIDMVLDGRIDAAAIDSTVLELAAAARPQLLMDLRVIESLGPSPMPPWVVTKNVAPSVRDAIRTVFWDMHRNAAGRALLRPARIKKMAGVTDRDYDPIRKMAQSAENVRWTA